MIILIETPATKQGKNGKKFNAVKIKADFGQVQGNGITFQYTPEMLDKECDL